jgi:sugar lactone lactonase YvrE
MYFVAMTADGAAVFSVGVNENGTPGTLTRLAVGDRLSMPTGLTVSTDGTTLYIADPGSELVTGTPPNQTRTLGFIFSMPIGGGALTSLAAAEGTAPKSLELVTSGSDDVIYFTGRDPANGRPTLWRMPADGSSKELVTQGSGDPDSVAAELMDPSALVVTQSGVVYVSDSLGAEGLAGILKVEAGAVSRLVNGLRLGYPAGIALDLAEKTLFVSGHKPDKSAAVYAIDLTTGTSTIADIDLGDSTESGGLRRARNADIFGWADSDGSEKRPAGTVFLVR